MNGHDSSQRDEPRGSADSQVIDYECPHCGEALQSQYFMVGQFDSCPLCGSIFTVPRPAVSLGLVYVIALAVVVVIALATTAFFIARRGPQGAPTTTGEVVPGDSATGKGGSPSGSGSDHRPATASTAVKGSPAPGTQPRRPE